MSTIATWTVAIDHADIAPVDLEAWLHASFACNAIRVRIDRQPDIELPAGLTVDNLGPITTGAYDVHISDSQEEHP